jgi:hypothetical protein
MEKLTSIRIPFTAKTPSEFTSTKVANLNKLSSDKNLKTKLGSMKVFEFWISARDNSKTRVCPLQRDSQCELQQYNKDE